MAEIHEAGGCSTSNRLLGALPPESLDRLQSRLEPIELKRREVVHAAGAPLEHVYFIDSGMVSLVRSMRDGRLVEVAAVGVEGLAGQLAVLGLRRAVVDAVVQLPLSARRLAVGVLREEMARDEALRSLLLNYAEAALGQLAQTAACNRLHTLSERCSRWLLIANDNAGTRRFRLTHEHLALMLGVQRPGLSITAQALQEAGLIRYHNGEMEVLDRIGLEAAACECYRTVQANFDRLLGPAQPRWGHAACQGAHQDP